MTKGEKRWQVYPHQSSLSEKIGAKLERPAVIGQLLLNRNIKSIGDAERFLLPQQSQSQFEESDLAATAELVEDCIKNRQTIFLFGDYDVDGITSTTLMAGALTQIGAIVEYYIPNRFTDGYGLSMALMDRVKKTKASLLITLDCGITNVAEITAIKKELGIKVAILDHHTIPDTLPPADAILNPKTLAPDHPLFHLCTVGVAFKFIEYYADKFNKDLICNSFLDLVALGTVADIAVLKGENRYLTQLGLKVLAERKRVGLNCLLECASFKSPTVTPRDVGFVIAPMLNAAGRLKHAQICVKLLLTQEYPKAKKIALELYHLNLKRREIGATIFEESVAMLDKAPHQANVTVLAAAHWHIGVIGITASQLVNKYGKPAVVIAIDNGMGRGSARTIGSVSIYNLLKACSHHFTVFGGHKEAAGFSIKPENIPAFKKEIEALSLSMISKTDLKDVLEIDCHLAPKDINMDLANELAHFAPFGQGNPAPLFYTNTLRPVDFKRVGDGSHIKVTFTDADRKVAVDAIGFGLGHKLELLHKPHVELAYHLEINEWSGRRNTQLQLVDIK
jgi:single-stranded-DNA-specific exonuclease